MIAVRPPCGHPSPHPPPPPPITTSLPAPGPNRWCPAVARVSAYPRTNRTISHPRTTAPQPTQSLGSAHVPSALTIVVRCFVVASPATKEMSQAACGKGHVIKMHSQEPLRQGGSSLSWPPGYENEGGVGRRRGGKDSFILWQLQPCREGMCRAALERGAVPRPFEDDCQLRPDRFCPPQFALQPIYNRQHGDRACNRCCSRS